jgi:hypothetical protein
MNPRLARMLVRLYPRAWRERYGTEFEAVLERGRGDFQTFANVVRSALGERLFPTVPDSNTGPTLFQSWCARAPWAMFGIAPLVLLVAAYFVACFILWSGWRFFLPGMETPFAVRLHGVSILYFGVGRWLYFYAPMVIGWAVAVTAARKQSRAIWPVAGLILIALAGGAAQVETYRATDGGRVSLDFFFWHTIHTVILFTVTLIPYLILRIGRARRVGA